MRRRLMLAFAVLLILGTRIGDALAQAPSDAEAIKAANASYYAALSARDAGAWIACGTMTAGL
jgi:hypothetical protein